MKRIHYILLALICLALVYAFGPKTDYPKGSITSPTDLPNITQIDAYVTAKEARYNDIRPGNEAEVVWAGAKGQKTPYSIVYLHGFSASGVEGDPTHKEIAARYGCNLYIPRLRLHGREGADVMKDLTPQMLIDDAIEAIQVGKILGDSVILMSCSTGSTLSIIAGPEYDFIAGYIMYSPNIDLYDSKSDLLTMPWGEQILNVVVGHYKVLDYTPEQSKYWYSKYHSKSVIALQSMLEDWMHTDQFQKITKPLFVGYYYKDEDNHDDVVSVDAIKRFVQEVSTPESSIRSVNFPEAGHHVICSPRFATDHRPVIDKTDQFMASVLGLSRVHREAIAQ